MIKKEMVHPLRTITLRYDELKHETSFEKELVSQYIALHTLIDDTKKECHRILYFYNELDTETTKTEKEFQPLQQAFSSYQQQLKHFAGSGSRSMEEVQRLQELSNKCYDTIPAFREQLNTLAARSDEMQEQYHKYLQLEDKMYNELDKYRALSLEFCKNYEAHSLGLHSLHQDEQECYGHVDDLSQKMERGREPVILHYNQLMKEVDDVYRGLEASKKTLTDFYDDQHLLDSSISDKCKENYDKATCPVYLTPPGDKRIETHRDLLGMWANSANKTFHLTVAVDVVKLGQVSMIQEIIMALQHYPKLIEKTIFAIDIVFIDELKIEITPDRWKGISEPMKWFAKMNSLPCAMFFLSDHDARAYALMGDLVAGNKLPVEMRGNDQQVRIQGEMLQEIVNRLFNACWFFMLYCHNTGFDPTSYIQAIIADFDLPFTYEDVLKKYNEDIKIGIHIRTIEEVKNNPQ